MLLQSPAHRALGLAKPQGVCPAGEGPERHSHWRRGAGPWPLHVSLSGQDCSCSQGYLGDAERPLAASTKRRERLPGLEALVPYVCRGAGQPPVQRGCLACSPAEVLTEPPAFLLGTMLGTRALPTLNKNLKILSGIYQNSCHRVNFMVLGSDPIPHTEVQH